MSGDKIGDKSGDKGGDKGGDKRQKLPPASFDVLVQVMAAPCLVHLGMTPNPMTGKTDRDLEQAKWTIDLLHVLEEKTRGNTSAAEKAQLDQILHQFRQVYAAAKS